MYRTIRLITLAALALATTAGCASEADSEDTGDQAGAASTRPAATIDNFKSLVAFVNYGSRTVASKSGIDFILDAKRIDLRKRTDGALRCLSDASVDFLGNNGKSLGTLSLCNDKDRATLRIGQKSFIVAADVEAIRTQAKAKQQVGDFLEGAVSVEVVEIPGRARIQRSGSKDAATLKQVVSAFSSIEEERVTAVPRCFPDLSMTFTTAAGGKVIVNRYGCDASNGVQSRSTSAGILSVDGADELKHKVSWNMLKMGAAQSKLEPR
jgi:hypothetical protein